MYILGIYDGHNSTASLLKDGKIVACASEERFKRKKNWVGYPEQAVNYCLESQNITSKDLSRVVLAARHTSLLWNLIKREAVFEVDDYIHEQYAYFKRILLDKEDKVKVSQEYFSELMLSFGSEFEYDISSLKQPLTNDTQWLNIRLKRVCDHLGINDKIIALDHHDCHKHYALYSSPFIDRNCLVLTLDAWGDDGTNATVSVYKDRFFTEIHRTSTSNIARLYRYITLILGMKPNEHEYKVMGLAPYANDKDSEAVYKIFDEVYGVDCLDFTNKKKIDDIYFYFKSKLEGHRFDAIAGGLQRFTNELVTKWVRNCIEKTGINNVVYSGGVSMNIKTNMEISKMPEVGNIFVPASGGDESLAIGACYAGYDGKKTPLYNVYLGPKDNKTVDGTVKTPTEIAKMLRDGCIIARFNDRMEFGARALGNRSILAHPSLPNIRHCINQQIKNRDFWMPFAVSLLEETANRYVINPKGLMSPFMTIAFESTLAARTQLSEAIHPWDFTVRPQFVNKTNETYYDILKAFEGITGIGGILNTSFNLHGEPIVCTVDDAMKTFYKSGLKYMLVNDILIEKE